MTAAALPIAPRVGTRFALTYALIAGIAFTIYGFPSELFGAREDWLARYLAGYARVAGYCLSWFEPGITISGAAINGRFPLQIVRNCDAIEVNILFASAVLAYPARLWHKVLPLSLGLAALLALNVARICALYFTGVYCPGAFRVAHEEVLPLVLVALATLAFLACARYLGQKP